MSLKIIDFFLSFVGEEKLKYYDLKRRKLFIKFLIVSIFILLSYSVIHLFFENYSRSLVDLIVSIGICLILYFYKKTGAFLTASLSYLFTSTALICYLHVTSPPTVGTNILWASQLIIMAIYTLEKKYVTPTIYAMIVIFALSEYLKSKKLFIIIEENYSEIYYFNSIAIILVFILDWYIAHSVHAEDSDLKNKLNIQYNRVKELNESNSALVSLLCHDLSTPLSVMSFNLQQLKSKIHNPEDTSKLNDMIIAQENIANLIRNVREIKAIETGKRQIKLRPVNLNRVVNKTIEQIQINANKKNISIRNKFQDDHYVITAEPNSLCSSVLANILSNAVKFSNHNSVIDIDANILEDQIQLIIKDYGVGVPKHILPYLFDPNVSTTRAGTENEDGTGFGLPIAKMFLELYEARVEVQSELNQGTTFMIYFKRSES
jgi:signal transduction histidine kinase